MTAIVNAIKFWKARTTFTFSFIDLSARLWRRYDEGSESLQKFLEVGEVGIEEDDSEEANEEGNVVMGFQILQQRVLGMLSFVA